MPQPHTLKSFTFDRTEMNLATNYAKRARVLNNMKDTEAKEMTVGEFKPLVEEFIQNDLKEHECVYPSEIAEELGLDARASFRLLPW
jgi:hypothetical protein